MIHDKTGVLLSESTLRRVFGKTPYPHLPSEITLNTLSIFAGYESWRMFQKNQKLTKGDPTSVKSLGKIELPVNWIFLLASLSMVVVLMVYFKPTVSTAGTFSDYQFSSRPITRSIPNTVVFRYRVDPKEMRPVNIQQSWDARTKTQVRADDSTYSSIYYQPGFFQAKLLVGGRVVAEHPLIIPTNGWLGMIARQPVPIYLDNAEFEKSGALVTPAEIFGAHQVSLEPVTPFVKLFNVGNFTPVDIKNVDFTAVLRSNYSRGSGICMKAYAELITEAIPITFALSAPGCVGELAFFNGSGLVIAKNTDLSGFGVDLHDWVSVRCCSDSGKLKLIVNGKRAYSCGLPQAPEKIVGIGFGFEGGGAVRRVRLMANGKISYSAY